LALLEGREITKRFGGVLALEGVDFALEKGQIVGLIGPNGAGKTTLFNIVAGTFRPNSGRVVFEGRDVTDMPAYRICRSGIARTFQISRPFGEMTCLENVGVALINNPLASTPRPWRQTALEYLDYAGLLHRPEVAAKDLNLIEKKKLEMARALAAGPRLLLLDEVLGGLNTQEIGQAVELIRRLRDERGLTIFWIEHVMGAIMGAADRVLVLDQGRKLMEGTPSEVAHDPRTITAYLGEG
jgi:branched-chain amino acid transport system ATP-binding protein